MKWERFVLVGFTENDPRKSKTTDNVRLVCEVDQRGGGRLAIWGTVDSRANIDAVLEAGMPCVVECDTLPPTGDFEEKYGHTHWSPQDGRLRVLRRPSD